MPEELGERDGEDALKIETLPCQGRLATLHRGEESGSCWLGFIHDCESFCSSR
jgi:hypothetical protein